MKFADYEIVYLPKEQWEGVPIPMRYTTEEYYAVEMETEADGYGVQIRKRRLEEPISHYPEEYDFPDKLYQAHWEKADARGIVDEAEGERRLILLFVFLKSFHIQLQPQKR